MSFVAVYIPQCAQTHRVDWIYHTAKSLSAHLPVVLFDVHSTGHQGISSGISLWRALWGRAKTQQGADWFIFWKTIPLVPFYQISFMRDINIIMNIVLIRLILFSGGVRPVLIAPPLPPRLFHIIYFWLSPSRVIGDITDFFPQEYRQALLRVATSVLVNSKQMQQLVARQPLPIHMASAGYFSDKVLESLAHGNVVSQESKTILCIAHIDWRLDFDLIEAILHQFPTYRLVFIGEEVYRQHQKSGDAFLVGKAHETQKKWERLRTNPRVELYTEHIYKLVQSGLKATVGVIPYITTNPFNAYCHPTKTYIYGCLGLSMVTTNLKIFSYDTRDYIYVAKTTNQFLSSLRSAIAHPMTRRQRMDAVRRAKSQTYGKKSTVLYSTIATDEDVKR